MTQATLNDDSLKNSLAVSAALHILGLLALLVGMPTLFPPLPSHHPPVPFEIVTIADITNTRVKEPEEQTKPPEPPPPPPAPKPEPAAAAPQKPPEPEPVLTEAIKPAQKPTPPKPVEKPQQADFSKLLKDLATTKKTETPKSAQTNPDSKSTAAPSQASAAPSLSDRLTISQEDALRRQISQCWNMPIGARDAQNLVVVVAIDVNPDRTVRNAEVVDKMRMATDSFFRAAAESALRALYNPKCTPLELPPDQYQQWKHIDFTFDPREML